MSGQETHLKTMEWVCLVQVESAWVAGEKSTKAIDATDWFRKFRLASVTMGGRLRARAFKLKNLEEVRVVVWNPLKKGTVLHNPLDLERKQQGLTHVDNAGFGHDTVCTGVR